MSDIGKLKSKMVENGLSVDLLAEKTGISRDTLYRRIRNSGDDFTVSEVDCISKAMNLSINDIMLIFFASEVA